MSRARGETGRRGEELAAAHLSGEGYRLIARNWRCKLGEIDLVARHEDWLVVVEVRTRRAARAFGRPEESIGPQKQARLARLAQAYVSAVQWQGPWRIDVIALELSTDGRALDLRHYPGAVGG
jgi:putative endonuclease